MKLSDRYLSSKIEHNKGEFDLGNGRLVPFKNYTLIINFIAGEKPSQRTMTFKEEYATYKEAKDMEGKALTIIKDCLNKLYIKALQEDKSYLFGGDKEDE